MPLEITLTIPLIIIHGVPIKIEIPVFWDTLYQKNVDELLSPIMHLRQIN